MRKRHFTLAQANSLLSRVRPRIERMMQLNVHLRASTDGDVAPAPPGTPWMADPLLSSWEADESEQACALTACLYETLSEELKGIEALGAEVKDLSIGLTVFPSFLDGSTEALLTWTVREAEIHSFYTAQSSYKHRKPVEGHTFTAVRTPSGQLRE